MTTKTLVLIALPLSVLLLSGCNKNPQNNTENSTLGAVPNVPEAKDIVPSTSGKGSKAQFLAAAEPFEGLTEVAFDQDLKKVDAAIAKANAAAPTFRPLLATSAQSVFDRRIAEINAARAAGNRAGLAQSSIEIYRVLVTEGSGASAVPSEVSLLDYAGFRYMADLQATPIRWDDMVAATDFAKQNWAIVKPQIKEPATVTKFQAAIDNMAASAAIKNADRAKASGGAELDLVDVLEQSFNAP
jgi:hypothetical protein